MIKLKLFSFLLLISACSTTHNSRKLASLDGQGFNLEILSSLKPDCRDQKKYSPKEMIELYTHDPKSYELYMSCKHIKRHSNRDHFGKCEKRADDFYSVKGKISYGSKISPYLGAYRYDVIKESGRTKIQVRIHFHSDSLETSIDPKYFPSEHIAAWDAKINSYADLIDFYLKKASNLWSEHSPFEDVSFEFIRTTEEENSHFSVDYKIQENKAMLYNKYWNVDAVEESRRPTNKSYTNRTFSHEIGHMMGLEDEISRLKEIFSPSYAGAWLDEKSYHVDCSDKSLMCHGISPKEAIPLPYHYYLILKRIESCYTKNPV